MTRSLKSGIRAQVNRWAARSRKIGAGAISFSAAFSAGKALLAVKDDIRISVFSIETGKLIGHVKGLHHPRVVNPGFLFWMKASGLSASSIYLRARKIEEQQFADEIVLYAFLLPMESAFSS